MQEHLIENNRSIFYTANKITGKMTVIFESGLGDNAEVWSSVLGFLDNNYSYLTYDRAGLGKSEIPEYEQTVESAFTDLAELIQVEKLQPPYLLVGHSYGGVLIKHYAEILGEDCVGLVLVDGSDESFKEVMFSYRDHMQSEYWSSIVNQQAPESAKGPNREYRAYQKILRSTIELSVFKEKPAISLVCDNLMRLDKKNRSSVFDEIQAPFDILERDNVSWIEVHEKWKQENPNLQMEVVRDCSHYIHKERPDLVAKAIHDIFIQTTNNKHGLGTRSSPQP